ncbi:hypothetical protein [Thermocaproicibacter melissae]|uniref:hypothetical protein n=1 Tax=Thermocaproicibacter melissae TaxID=2966552 RepID=UPI003A0FE8FB
MRERGLKFKVDGNYIVSREVAPHAGAWIEINIGIQEYGSEIKSLPMRERGLKLF